MTTHTPDPDVIELINRAKALTIPLYAICDRAGISNPTLTKWQSGENQPSYRLLKLFKKAVEECEKEFAPPE